MDPGHGHPVMGTGQRAMGIPRSQHLTLHHTTPRDHIKLLDPIVRVRVECRPRVSVQPGRALGRVEVESRDPQPLSRGNPPAIDRQIPAGPGSQNADPRAAT